MVWVLPFICLSHSVPTSLMDVSTPCGAATEWLNGHSLLLGTASTRSVLLLPPLSACLETSWATQLCWEHIRRPAFSSSSCSRSCSSIGATCRKHHDLTIVASAALPAAGLLAGQQSLSSPPLMVAALFNNRRWFRHVRCIQSQVMQSSRGCRCCYNGSYRWVS